MAMYALVRQRAVYDSVRGAVSSSSSRQFSFRLLNTSAVRCDEQPLSNLESVALGQQDDTTLNEEIKSGKRTMTEMGYHGPSIWVQNICWGDHDQFQHVNNVHYVRFIESNRMLFAEKLAEKFTGKRKMDILRGTGESFILQSIAVRYRRPVVYPDTLLIGKKPILPLGKDRFTLQCGLYSLTQKAIVATAEEISVTYDYRSLRKIDMPQDFRQILEEIGRNPDA